MDPQTGGKVPEAAHHRLRLNMIDHLGLRDPEAVRMAGEMVGAEPGQDLGMCASSLTALHIIIQNKIINN